MPNYEKIKYIFGRLGFSDPLDIYFHNIHLFDVNESQELFGGDFTQKGGKYDEKIYAEYKNEKYLFHRFKEKDYIFYVLNQNEKLGDLECIMIIVDQKLSTCTIKVLSLNDKCFTNKNIEKDRDMSGSDLLKVALKLIDKIKDRYKIKKIKVEDNARKICIPKKRINLGMMLTLLNGDTWYGKYGFYPQEKNLIDKYKNNKEIINKVRMKDVSSLRTMIMMGLEECYGYRQKIFDNVMTLYDKYYNDNRRIKTFLKKLLNSYDSHCELFYYFYEDLHMKLKLFNFMGKSFVKDIS